MADLVPILDPETRTAAYRALAVLDELAWLTADQIAEKLQAEVITGQRGNPQSCPIQALLRRRTDLSTVIGNAFVSDGLAVVASLPRSVREFVSRFDRGCYPDLVEEAADG